MPTKSFLFVIMMTVLLQDAKGQMMKKNSAQFSTEYFVNELVYADDTLLIDVDPDTLHAFMLLLVKQVLGTAADAAHWNKSVAMPNVQTELKAAWEKSDPNMFGDTSGGMQ